MVSSHPPTSTASADSPTSSSPFRSSTMPGMTRAKTRRPPSSRIAVRAGVWISSSSSESPMPRSSVASTARDRVELFVTKRSAWPDARSCSTASTAPGIGSPETDRTPSTSSKMHAMDGESIRVRPGLYLPLTDVELRVSRSSGPGGQHANTAETRVEALLDVEACSVLTEGQKQRVTEKAGPVLRAVAQDERSQARNRELALERLAEKLREALRVPRKRRPTRPTAAAREQRLEDKRRRGEVKRLRRDPE